MRMGSCISRVVQS